MALDNNNALVLKARTETKPEEEQPFRFLDLPKELRLMVYDYLVDREHHKISIVEDDESADITLVTPAPVPQIYLTCKELHAEAVPFLQKKVAKLGLSRTAPRIVIGGRCGNLTSSTIELMIRFTLFELDRLTEGGNSSDWSCSEDETLIRAMLKRIEMHHISAFCKMASRHLLKANEYGQSWYLDAYESLETWNSLEGLSIEYEAKVEALSRYLAAAPDAKYTALQILFVGEGRDEDGLGGFESSIFDYVEDSDRIRLYTYTRNRLGWKERQGQGPVDWVYHGGELDEEIWRNEWALNRNSAI